MKISSDELENKARESLNSCLSRVPFLKIEDIKRRSSTEASVPDFLINIALPGCERCLVVEIKINGQPRMAREAVNQILRSLYSPKAERILRVFLNSPGKGCKSSRSSYCPLSCNEGHGP